GPGIMEAANRGAWEVGAPSIGFNITLPLEQQPNRFTTPELTFRFHYFAMRKMHLAMRANALIIFPGGFGTMDELFEILTLRQTGKAPRVPIVLFDRDYWRRIVNFDAFAEEGMISKADLDLFDFAETPEEVWESLMRHGLRAHGCAHFAQAALLLDLRTHRPSIRCDVKGALSPKNRAACNSPGVFRIKGSASTCESAIGEQHEAFVQMITRTTIDWRRS